ncbi:MAG: major capsid protein E [Bacteroidales bacterium]|nr:major capsid protein E [Bacteroidales bacterium]MCM1148168.1 major capsid protein E [Bacteroidales bacterium]MCM1207105.1 major capsid protein E [Bacillota bacterium]MCM1510857.1 hypothetical protein [Clostridium sp.]
MPEFTTSSIFGELTRVVTARLDRATQKHVRLYDNVLYDQFLDWDTPTIELDFKELMGTYNMSVTAATVGDNSNEPVMDTDGAETYPGSVYRHAMTRPLTVQEYRKILALKDSKYISPATVRNELIKLMWKTVSDPVKAVQNKLDLIFLTALSNKGKFEFTRENNPLGGVYEKVDYKMPEENMATVTEPWTEDNLDTVDCFADIQQMLELASEKSDIGEILVDQSVINYMLRSRQIKLILNGTDHYATPRFLTDLNAFMQSNGLPAFRPIKRLVKITKDAPSIKPWNADNMVFVPSGKLGVIKNALADSEVKPSPGVSYSNYGRIRVAQWSVGEKENSPFTEFAKAESLSLPVITEIGGIFNLNLKGEK